jgi:hypothetical protein
MDGVHLSRERGVERALCRELKQLISCESYRHSWASGSFLICCYVLCLLNASNQYCLIPDLDLSFCFWRIQIWQAQVFDQKTEFHIVH